MPRPVAHITARPPSYEEMMRELRIPKTRQKQMRAMLEVWKKRQAEKQTANNSGIEWEEKCKNVSAAG